jgi:uncharacterized protein (DUF2062 family)
MHKGSGFCRLVMMVIAVIVAIWLAVNVVLPVLGFLVATVLPLAFIAFVGWFVYRILASSDPRDQLG